MAFSPPRARLKPSWGPPGRAFLHCVGAGPRASGRFPLHRENPLKYLALAALFLGGCSTTAGVAAVGQSVAAAPCAVQYAAAPVAAAPCAPAVQYAPAAAPCATAGTQVVQVVGAPQVAANGVQYVQVQYRVGAAEWGRAGLAIPGNVIVCVGNAVRCLTEALFPIPVPSAQLVAAPAPQPIQVWQPAAAPCAPAAPAPAGKWVWQPGMPPPEPVSSTSLPCPGSATIEVCCGPEGCCVPTAPVNMDTPPDMAYASK